ncbi:chorismate-binding protein [Kocuria rosea]|uniref:chorismate-binding protein n=1 Tax=Kocuria rosea TaxID=1275 RepID=UPI0009E6AE8F|nr:chorismate-binding protein [Kocuria polaris]
MTRGTTPPAVALAPLPPETAPAAGLDSDLVLAGRRGVLFARRDRTLPAAPITGSGIEAALARLGEATCEAFDSGARRATGPVLCGTVPFDPDEPADLFLAERPVWSPRPAPESSVPLVRQLAPSVPAPDADHREALAEALDRIGRGAAQHLVLARALDLELPAPVDLDRLWEELVARAAGGHAFLVRPRDGGAVLGAGPELTAEVGPVGFAAHPHTGCAARHPTVSGDAAAQQSLLRSPAARRRHQHVVEHLARGLAPYAASLHVPAQPSVLGTDAAWHLATRLTGRLHRGTSALHAAVALHRAAVGTPGREAMSLIRELEPRPRGAFAGLVGWTDAAGHGQWVPVLRSVHLHGTLARLHAAAELDATSTVDGAVAETAANFGTVRAALAAAGARERDGLCAGVPDAA